ncbi:MAG: zinc-binding dehydrogenase [Deltaproteobacteria bacterium]|nr:zinc-binding dehydrogenase [Deltaproteobacteria bacterium]MBW2111498.1 zinc-binding dehydrogenase [Deltaproteobacteria bacterium]
MGEEKMMAARLHEAKRPLKIDEIDIPSPGPGEALVEMKACGICATDVHTALDGTVPTSYTPITLGHEPSGVIKELGDGVRGWKQGDRVAIYPQITCGTCPQCREGRDGICTNTRVLGMHRDGAFADYIVIPIKNLVRIPDNVSFMEAAIMTDAGATPFHAVTKRGRVKPGETVAIFGCGGLGMNAVQFCRLAGAAKIIAVDTSDYALERAGKVGADIMVNAGVEKPYKEVIAANGGYGVDVAFEFVGINAVIDQAVRSLRRGGRAVTVGIGPEPIKTIPPFFFVYNDLALIGSFGSDIGDLEKLMGLATSGKLDLTESVSSVITLNDINQGILDLEKKVGNPVRIVVSME